MLDQDGHEALYRAENGSVDSHRSSEAGFEGLFVPHEVLIIALVFLKHLRGHLHFSLIIFVLSSLFLLFGRRLGLVL